MKRSLFIAVLLVNFFLFLTISNAQNKELSLSDAVTFKNGTLFPKRLNQLNFIEGTDLYYFVRNDSILIFSTNGVLSKSINLEELNRISKLELKRIPLLTSINETTFQFSTQNKVVEFNFKNNFSKIILELPDNIEEQTFSPNYKSIAYVKNDNLFIDNTQITNDGGKGIVKGKAVHRNEFGINNGIFWSPNSQKIAYYRMDETMVADYPLYNINTTPTTINNFKYPMAGGTSHQVNLIIYDIETKKNITIKTGKPKEQYLTNIAWDNEGKSVFIHILNREQNHAKLNMYNSETGEFIKTIIEEKSNKYVEPLAPIQFLKNSNQFIYQSKKSGYNQLYLFNSEGKEITQLTKQKGDVIEVLKIDDTKKYLYYTVASEDGLNRFLYRVNLKNYKNELITTKPGIHNCKISSKGWVIDNYSYLNNESSTYLINSNTKNANQIFVSDNTLSDYKLGNFKIDKLTTSNNTQLNYRIIFPPNFDSTKKYKTLVYLYGGPHAQMVNNGWLGGGNLWFFYMAQQGYIVFTLDNRGSAYRGLAFEQATHKNLGEEEKKDQMVGINYLKTLPYVDTTKLAIHGWSFGGFMTTNMLLSYPNLFKVGVAGGPVMDWNMYEIMYTERYMAQPTNNEKGYQQANLINKVKQLKDPLLIIHGQDDDVVVLQHSLKFLDQCVKNNVQVDFFVYPNHSHNVRGKDRVHLMQKITDYIELHINQ